MAGMFDAKELVKVAIQDEITGAAFYAGAAAKSGNPELKETFVALADQERGHRKRFEEMLDAMGDYQSPEQYPGEYTEYLNSLATDRAFPDEAAAVAAVGACAGDAEVLDLSLRIERDTLKLMEEMQKLVAERDRAVVETLADEERSHIEVLTAAREGLAG